MKRFNNILIIALGMVLLASCSRESIMSGDEPLPKGAVGIKILLPASTDIEVQGAKNDKTKTGSDGAQTSRASRAVTTPGTSNENLITNLKFFIVHTAADGKEVIKRIVEVKDPTTAYPNDPDANALWNSSTNVLTIRNMKNPDETHKVFVVANWADAPTTLTEGAPLETLTGAITHLTAAIPTPDDKHPMVMSGFTANHNFATTPLVKVPIEHQAARFRLIATLAVGFYDAYKEELLFGDPVDNHISVEVGNTHNSSYVFRQSPPAMPADAAELPITLQMVRTVYNPEPGTPYHDTWASISEFIYLYENPVAGIAEYAKAHATYFLFNIPYYKKNDPAKQLTNNYYKVKVYDYYDTANPNRYTTLRNTYYDVFAGIVGFGSTDPTKAVEIAAEVTVKPWSDIDVDGDITDQKPPINSKLEILTADPRVVYVNNVRDAALSRINFWTDRPAAEVLLDPIVKTGENFDTEINVAEYFNGITDLHLTSDRGGFNGYIELNPIDGKVLPGGNVMKIKVKLTAGGITKELTVRDSYILDFLATDDSRGLTLFDYHQWTGTVADGNNGSYQNSLIVARTDERPYARLEIASADATTSAVGWANARTSCPSGWRLPRVAELNLMYAKKNLLTKENRFATMADTYWSASETDVNNSWGLNFSTGIESAAAKTTPQRVRCVRNVLIADKVEIVYDGVDPRTTVPASGIFPIETPIPSKAPNNNARFFNSWNTKKDNTGVTYHPGQQISKTGSQYIKLYAIWQRNYLGYEKALEISKAPLPAMSWAEAMGLPDTHNTLFYGRGSEMGPYDRGCNTLFGPGVRGWRVPTPDELIMIGNVYTVNGDTYAAWYWSANEPVGGSAVDNAYAGLIAPNGLARSHKKTILYEVRCVRTRINE